MFTKRSWKKPAAEQIVNEIKNIKGFITELVDEEDFYNYMDNVNGFKGEFDVSNRLISYNDFKKAFENNIYVSYDLLYPMENFKKLNIDCKILVKEVKNDLQKQFIVGKSLVEGENEFPKNIEFGLQYIKQSCNIILLHSKTIQILNFKLN